MVQIKKSGDREMLTSRNLFEGILHRVARFSHLTAVERTEPFGDSRQAFPQNPKTTEPCLLIA
jgi:hypothetical protein